MYDINIAETVISILKPKCIENTVEVVNKKKKKNIKVVT